MGRRVGAAVGAAAVAILLAPVAPAQTAIFVNGTTLNPLTAEQQLALHRSEFGGHFAADDIVTAPYPASLWPLTPDRPDLGASVAAGVSATAALLRQTHGPIVLIGTSQGALVVDQVLRDLAGDSHAPETDDLTVVVVADPTRPGGIASRVAPGTWLPILDYTVSAPPQSRYDTIVLKQQYDGVADFPDRPWNLLATVNALAGIVYLHTGLDKSSYAQIPGSGGVSTVNVLEGRTTTYLLPTGQLPLTRPLRDLGVPAPAVDAIDAVLRPVIDAGYLRNDPTPPRGAKVGAAPANRAGSKRNRVSSAASARRPSPAAATPRADRGPRKAVGRHPPRPAG